MKRRIRLAVLFLVFALVCGHTSAGAFEIGEIFGWVQSSEKKDDGDYYENLDIDEDGSYDTKDEVCAYLVQFHHLPSNYMTKKEARKEGWEGGPLHKVISGMCIGGDYFGNYDGVLPDVKDREYHECDIDTLSSSSRGAKRIVYSGDDDNGDWNIYYTDDHYETFTLLWGEDDYEK